MHVADDNKSQPTKGIFASCSSPCIVPSSPFKTGMTASTFIME